MRHSIEPAEVLYNGEIMLCHFIHLGIGGHTVLYTLKISLSENPNDAAVGLWIRIRLDPLYSSPDPDPRIQTRILILWKFNL